MYPIDYNFSMFTIVRSEKFDSWLTGLKDLSARSRILNRMDNIQKGSLGDYKSLGKGLFELRIHYGPGYRVYFTHKDDTIIFLLIGGDKSSQTRDIAIARSMMEE
ncbi:type II toxin-antitoxin system RelE/ParE family toxin [Desulfovibrio sp. ZJ200]|uniref:type II toxin-antitoxin system RelE/ParE family toxin n=1 Tax=Desulfovibrio sp. ZJ200 TaxID=2709792 RepID=UPI001F157167|nr:type II toxin-antitoxin system RelE/ParE family toxin [Desulfovibrio sp. ZJ200]